MRARTWKSEHYFCQVHVAGMRVDGEHFSPLGIHIPPQSTRQKQQQQQAVHSKRVLSFCLRHLLRMEQPSSAAQRRRGDDCVLPGGMSSSTTQLYGDRRQPLPRPRTTLHGARGPAWLGIQCFSSCTTMTPQGCGQTGLTRSGRGRKFNGTPRTRLSMPSLGHRLSTFLCRRRSTKPVDVLQRLDFALPEQVIVMPKISLDCAPQRTMLLEPQPPSTIGSVGRKHTQVGGFEFSCSSQGIYRQPRADLGIVQHRFLQSRPYKAFIDSFSHNPGSEWYAQGSLCRSPQVQGEVVDVPELQRQVPVPAVQVVLFLEVLLFHFFDRVMDIFQLFLRGLVRTVQTVQETVHSTGAVLREVVDTPADVSTTGASRHGCALLGSTVDT